MDYLDQHKEFRQRVTIMVGYVLVAVAIAATAMVLLYQAYGFSVNSKGAVIQRGLAFVSSHPHPADIYINGRTKGDRTNTRLVLPAGIYNLKLTRSGYYDWQRTILLEGGSVEHFDYPFLFPKDIATKSLASFTAPPGLFSNSPDHRWLVSQSGAALVSLQVRDLKSPAKPPLELTLPSGLLAGASGQESWQPVEWADDNSHLLLEHDFDGKSEYILFDRSDGAKAVNLTTSLSLKAGVLSLQNHKSDRYYLYDQAAKSLQSLTLGAPTPKPVLDHVLAFKGFGDNTVLYLTDAKALAGKLTLRLTDGRRTWNIRSLPAGSDYVLDLAKYDGKLYVAAGAASDNRVYIYQDPAAQIDRRQGLAPAQVLRVEQVNYLSFSDNAQFVVAENGNHFGVYDIQNKAGHSFTTTQTIDAPQPHASWMDGNRLTYVSQGKQEVFDYDNLNHHSLTAATPGYLPAFDPDYKFIYLLAPLASGQYSLDQTSLLAPADR